MNEIGKLLKSTRIEKGLSLKDVAFETKINVDFLENIEENNSDLLPQKSYTRGFLRSYAHHLRLDTKEILVEFNRTMGSTVHAPQQEQLRKNTWKTIPIIGRLRLNKVNLSIGILALTITLVLASQGLISKYTSESKALSPNSSKSEIMSYKKTATDLILEKVSGEKPPSQINQPANNL